MSGSGSTMGSGTGGSAVATDAERGGARRVALAVRTPGPPFRFGPRPGLRNVLPFEDPRPVEIDVGVVLFDQADRVLVERGPTDAHARRRPEPVEHARSRPAATLRRRAPRRCSRSRACRVEAKRRQSLLPFLCPGSRPGGRLGRGRLRRGLRAVAPRGRAAALAGGRLAGGRFRRARTRGVPPASLWPPRARPPDRRASAAGERWTMVNRVWSPIVWKVQISATLTPFSAVSRRAMSTEPGRHVQMKRGLGPAEVRPLRHRLEMVDRLGGLDLDRPQQLLAALPLEQQTGRDKS